MFVHSFSSISAPAAKQSQDCPCATRQHPWQPNPAPEDEVEETRKHWCWAGRGLSISTTTGDQPWPGGSADCSVVPCTRRLWVRSPVRAHASVAGLVPSWGRYNRQPTDVSLSLQSIIVSSGEDFFFIKDHQRLWPGAQQATGRHHQHHLGSETPDT